MFLLRMFGRSKNSLGSRTGHSLRTQTYFRAVACLRQRDKRQPEIGLRSQAKRVRVGQISVMYLTDTRTSFQFNLVLMQVKRAWDGSDFHLRTFSDKC